MVSAALLLIGAALGAGRAARTGGPAAIVLAIVFIGITFCIGVAGFSFSIGLFFRKNWARIGALVWAGAMEFYSAFGILLEVVFLVRSMTRGLPSGRIIVGLTLFSAGFLIAGWWLILFTRRSVIRQFTDEPPLPASPHQESAPIVAPGPPLPLPPIDPIYALRGRAILLSLILSALGSVGVILIIRLVSFAIYGRSVRAQSPALLAVLPIVLYGSIAFSMLYLIRRVRLTTSAFLGLGVDWPQLRKYWFLPLFLPAVSVTFYYAVFWPLSFALPRFVAWFLFGSRSDEFITTTGSAYPIVNIITMLSVVILAPVIEEFLFRGLLLTRWSVKWGAPRAILLSSAIFGILHKEFLGHMFFGYVMAVLYIETKSLLVPMLMHAANNALAYALALLASLAPSTPRTTLATFQAERGLVIALSVIFIPLVLMFLWRHFPSANWRLPYETSRGLDPQPAAQASTAAAAL
jgi:membrane protease YdiL (CAAX protease family)